MSKAFIVPYSNAILALDPATLHAAWYVFILSPSGEFLNYGDASGANSPDSNVIEAEVVYADTADSLRNKAIAAVNTKYSGVTSYVFASDSKGLL